MTKLYAVILRYDTEAHQADSIATRKQLVEDSLKDASAHIAAQVSSSEKRRQVLGVFAAPEYLFANVLSHGNHQVGDVRHLDEATKAGLEAWLQGLSARYPHLLLFPGSIAWKKPLTRDLGEYMARKKQAGSKLDTAELTKRFQQKTLTRTEKAKASIRQNANDFQGGDLDRRVAGDMSTFRGWLPNSAKTCDDDAWWFETDDLAGAPYNGKRWTLDASKAARTTTHSAPSNREKLAELGGGAASAMARNTCLVYLNGKRIAKYHKAQDYHEVLDNGGTVYVPGKSVPVFDVEGIKYGVEICLDHAYASAADRLPSTAKPDVCVVLSAKVKLEAKNLANRSAMVVHACSEDSWSLVGKGGVADAQASLEATDSRYRIYSFNI